MRLVDLVLVLPFVSFAAACTSTVERPSKGEVVASVAEPKDGSKPDAKSGESGGDKESKSEKIEKKARALDDAKLELKISGMECDAQTRKAKDAVEDARLVREKAKDALDHFQRIDKELETKKAELDFERAKWGTEENKQELDELMAMYKKDEVATLTKELVIGRGKKRLEFANRNIEHAQKELSIKLDFEIPRKEKDLQRALDKAEAGLREALAEQSKQEKENELKLRRHEHSVDDLEKEIKKLKESKEDKEGDKKASKAARAATRAGELERA